MTGKNLLVIFLSAVFFVLIINGYICNRVISRIQDRNEYQQAQIDSLRSFYPDGDYATKESCRSFLMDIASEGVLKQIAGQNRDLIYDVKEKNDKRYVIINEKADKINDDIWKELRDVRLITEVIRDCKK